MLLLYCIILYNYIYIDTMLYYYIILLLYYKIKYYYIIIILHNLLYYIIHYLYYINILYDTGGDRIVGIDMPNCMCMPF